MTGTTNTAADPSTFEALISDLAWGAGKAVRPGVNAWEAVRRTLTQERLAEFDLSSLGSMIKAYLDPENLFKLGDIDRALGARFRDQLAALPEQIGDEHREVLVTFAGAWLQTHIWADEEDRASADRMAQYRLRDHSHECRLAMFRCKGRTRQS